jgi:NAD(P)-dependent dehydrogenase (short-subunit alcohol dehydrogenase family)
MRFGGRTAFITGAAIGFGRAFARATGGRARPPRACWA